MTVEVTSWRALGTYVFLAGDCVHLSRAAVRAAEVLEEVDASCSRFRADSDLSHVNAAAGSEVPISPVLHGAVCVALEAAEVTGGLIDPTLGAHLVAAGYDRTFSLVPSRSADPVVAPTRVTSWRDVVLTEEHLAIPEGSILDLGATGKAFAADLVATVLDDEFKASFLISVGGDLRVSRPRPDGGAYAVAIADRPEDPAACTVMLPSGAMATSSRTVRAWERAGSRWHHIIDPRTGAPADGPWRTVTAYGHTAVAANTATTAAMILGADALDWLIAQDVAARLVHDDSTVVTTPFWDSAFGASHD